MKKMSECPVCHYPATIENVGQVATCAYCGGEMQAISGDVSQGVTFPSWLVAGLAGLTLGIVLGPSIIASTESGSKWLAQKAREKIGS